jgi:hypothetical protein
MKSDPPFDKLPPWKRKKPGLKKSKKKLSLEQVAAAKARAESAGRRYPNLVDNMWAAKQKPERLPPSDPDPFDK